MKNIIDVYQAIEELFEKVFFYRIKSFEKRIPMLILNEQVSAVQVAIFLIEIKQFFNLSKEDVLTLVHNERFSFDSICQELTEIIKK